MHIVNSRCYLEHEVPAGYGGIFRGARGETLPCFAAQCDNCQKNYMVCSRCKVSDPPLYLYRGRCVYADYLPNYIGGDSATLETKRCLVANCLSCKENYRVCDKCIINKGRQMYLYKPANICVFSSSIPAGFGSDSSNRVLKPCAISNCTNCQNNYLICSHCNSKLGFYLKDS
jgi:hypothetical protein